MQLSSHFTRGNKSDENKIKDFHLVPLLLANVTASILSVGFFYSKLNKSLYVVCFPCLQIIAEKRKTPKSCEVGFFPVAVHVCNSRMTPVQGR